MILGHRLFLLSCLFGICKICDSSLTSDCAVSGATAAGETVKIKYEDGLIY